MNSDMPTAQHASESPLTGRQLKLIRRWLGLQLGPFAELTSEAQATIARREQYNVAVGGPTGALLLVLNYLYGLHDGPHGDKVEALRHILENDPTRRHFVGRFGAAALIDMLRDHEIPIGPLVKRVQDWIEQDHRQAVERVTTSQLQRTAGLSSSMIAGLVAGVVGGLSWAWLKGYFSTGKTRKK